MYSAADYYRYGQASVVRGGVYDDSIVEKPRVERIDDCENFAVISRNIDKEYLCESYNEEFFEDNSLIEISLFSPSGSFEMTYIDAQKYGDTVYVFLNENQPENYTDDCAFWTAFIPCDKEENEENIRVMIQRTSIKE